MFSFDVRQHPLAFGMVCDGLARDAGQIVNLFDSPALRNGAGAGALQVMLGTIAFGLFVAADPNPDANIFWRNNFVLFILHSTTSGKE